MEPARYREQIYDLFADPTLSLEETIEHALRLGTEYLGLSIGFLTQIDAGTQEIVQATGDHHLIQPGERCPLEEAYCRRTIELESVLAVADADTSAAISETAVETFGLGAYIGAKVVLEADTFGTVCFADHESRSAQFTEEERLFVELLARLVGQAKERASYERELAARADSIAEREEAYRSLIHASFDLVFRIEPDGTFSYVSPSVEPLLGYGPEDYVGEPFTVMLPDAQTATLAGDLFEQLMTGATVEEHYFPLQHSDGGTVFVDIRVTPMYDGTDSTADTAPETIVGVQGTARDATDRYRREQLNHVLNRVLRHNLRNDMNVIVGYAAALADSLEGADADAAERIAAVGEELLGLGETARELEKHLEDPPETTVEDIVAPVERATSYIAERYPDAGFDIEAPESAKARSAPRLETALVELLDNAAKHSGESPQIDVSIETAAATVTIGIADDGPGLPDQERTVLVDGNETPLVHGSGLGLWLVYWIVHSIDGQLEVRDEGEGTDIEIRLQRGQTA